MSTKNLTPEKALIFRITHRDNVPWLLENGLHCRNASVSDPAFVGIGNEELIDRRSRRDVEVPPYGTLSDYVPFYFTPFSPMLYNIKTGYGGVTQRRNEEIVLLVSSLHSLIKLGQRFVFTNKHAYLRDAEYFDDLRELKRIDWELLRSQNFKRDPDDPDKFARYEAEALIFEHLPLAGLLGMVCYNAATKNILQRNISEAGVEIDLKVLPGWYF